MGTGVQLLVDAVEFSREGPPDVSIFGIEGLFEGVLGLAEGLGLSLVGLDVGGEVIEFFLDHINPTSTVESRFLSDIKL